MPTNPQERAETLLVREQLTCRNGHEHYCPNCDNTIGMDRVQPFIDLIESQEQTIARLRAALELFLTDGRFQVAVGGNPNAVAEMMAEAKAALATVSRHEEEQQQKPFTGCDRSDREVG